MPRTVRFVVLVGLAAIAAVVLAGCGGGTAPVSGGTGTGPATASIGPAGGTVTSPDGVVTLTIPKGALTKTLTVGIGPASTAPGGAILTYELTPSGTTFAVPATLSVDTSALTLPKGSTEADVRIETAAGGAWKGLFTSLDSATHTASASLAHFSTYGVVAASWSSRLLLGWAPSFPIVSAAANSTTDAYQDLVTIHDATVPPFTEPSCGWWGWVNGDTWWDAGGVQWSASAPPPSVTPYPASAQEAFSVQGSGTGFTISTKIHASAGAGGALAAGFLVQNATGIYPDIVAEIDNPSGAQRTLSLRWASRASFIGAGVSDSLGGVADVASYYQMANGSCSRFPDQAFESPKFPAATPVEASVSSVIPSGAVKIWVVVNPGAEIEVGMDTTRTSVVQAELHDELDVQIE